LWAQNRGRYGVKAERIEAERYATLAYRGEIVVVTALTRRDPFEDYERGIMKKALIGNVLGPGDTPYDAMAVEQFPPVARPGCTWPTTSTASQASRRPRPLVDR